MGSRSVVGSAVVFACALWLAAPVLAQPARAGGPGKWEVELHVGGVLGRTPTSGDALNPFPEGTPILSGGGMRGTGPSPNSRAVSSWYFGDGATLLNQVNTGLGITPRITSLDPVLTRRLGARGTGGSFGVRVARRLGTRMAVEVGLDDHRTSARLSDEALAVIEASRATFVTAWEGLLATGSTSNRQVTSEAVVEEGDGHEVLVTGALTIDVGGLGRIQPYVVAGAGGAFYRGTPPSATLTGRYRFDFGSVFPMDETDVATVRAEVDDASFVTMFGGGLRLATSERHGLKIDVRIYLGRDRDGTRVDASPAVQTATPAFAISTAPGIPNIQFSNNSSTGRQSSLSGPIVQGLETFSGSGLRARTAVTIGYWRRF